MKIKCVHRWGDEYIEKRNNYLSGGTNDVWLRKCAICQAEWRAFFPEPVVIIGETVEEEK